MPADTSRVPLEGAPETSGAGQQGWSAPFLVWGLFFCRDVRDDGMAGSVEQRGQAAGVAGGDPEIVDAGRFVDPNLIVSLMIIGADTIVAKDNQIMGKPKDHDQAFDMLNLLQNNTHQVYTGVSIILYDFETKEKKVHSFHDCTDVEFYPMTDSEINSYIETGDCYDKAGSYGIQGSFAIHVKGIHGDYNNVVGLPIAKLYHELEEM